MKSISTDLLSKMRCCQHSFFPAGKSIGSCEDETVAVTHDSEFQIAFGEDDSIQVFYFHFGGFFFLFFLFWLVIPLLPGNIIVLCLQSYHMKEFPVHTVIESPKVDDFCGSDNHTIGFKSSPPPLPGLEPYASPRAPYFPFCPVLTLFPLYHVLPLVPRTSPNATVPLLAHRTSPRAAVLPLAPVPPFVPPFFPLCPHPFPREIWMFAFS